MKKPESLLKEYARRLSDEDLKYLGTRFQALLKGDRADIADFLSRDRSLDQWLSNSKSALEWFDMIDAIGDFVLKEHKKRFNTDDIK